MSTGPGEDLALPAVGYDGARYIVMYERLAGYYARTFDNGVLGPEIPLGVAAVGDGLTSGFIACRAPGDCLAAWEEQTPSSEFVNLVHVDAQGATAPPFPVDLGPAENPAVTFDGANYLVAWDTGTYGAPDAACDVYLTTIGGDGASILAKTPIATSPDNEYFGFVAAMEPGAAAVVYTRMVNDPSVLVTRMFARFVTDAEDGGADAGAADGGVVAEAGPPPVEGGVDAGHEGTRDAGTIASPASGPSGCGCRAGAGGTNAVASLGALGALGAFARGRRRRRPEAAR
jgi:MYXO-CTERM domain-containing protein